MFSKNTLSFLGLLVVVTAVLSTLTIISVWKLQTRFDILDKKVNTMIGLEIGNGVVLSTMSEAIGVSDIATQRLEEIVNEE